MAEAVTTATPATLAAAGADATIEALQTRFGAAVLRAQVINGQRVVSVAAGEAYRILEWLRSNPEQRFDYLTDLTCVEYRDAELPLEVVYQLRSLDRRVDLRLKIPLPPEGPLEVRSVLPLWRGANWLEREAWDMFGVVFKGHPDLRRILMWESYSEGHPLRKSFPLRGHWSRSEQTRQALAGDRGVHYSPEELAIAQQHHSPPAVEPGEGE